MKTTTTQRNNDSPSTLKFKPPTVTTVEELSSSSSVRGKSRTTTSLHNESSDINNDSSAPRIFIGCLPKKISKKLILKHFSQYGEILDLKMQVRDSSESNSQLINAFMTCSSQRMVEEILIRQQRILDCNIKVSRYMEKDELNKFISSSRKCRLYIKRLPSYFTNEQLLNLFEQFGAVKNAYCVKGTKSRKNWKYGYVVFEDEKTLKKIPLEGVFDRGVLIKWTSYELKQKKRKESGGNQQQQHQSQISKKKKKQGSQRKQSHHQSEDSYQQGLRRSRGQRGYEQLHGGAPAHDYRGHDHSALGRFRGEPRIYYSEGFFQEGSTMPRIPLPYPYEQINVEYDFQHPDTPHHNVFNLTDDHFLDGFSQLRGHRFRDTTPAYPPQYQGRGFSQYLNSNHLPGSFEEGNYYPDQSQRYDPYERDLKDDYNQNRNQYRQGQQEQQPQQNSVASNQRVYNVYPQNKQLPANSSGNEVHSLKPTSLDYHSKHWLDLDHGARNIRFDRRRRPQQHREVQNC